MLYALGALLTVQVFVCFDMRFHGVSSLTDDIVTYWTPRCQVFLTKFSILMIPANIGSMTEARPVADNRLNGARNAPVRHSSAPRRLLSRPANSTCRYSR